MKTAVIFGVTGQDGSYLTEFLLKKNYRVIGITRRCSVNNRERIKHIKDSNFIVVEGDITDASSVNYIIAGYKPNECYNLAAQSHVGTSFKQPSATFNINAVGVLNILESIRLFSSASLFYQASTSEQFGNNGEIVDGVLVQSMNTPFAPCSPYAVAKVAAHNLVATYRQSYGLHANCGILHNHESPRRGENFVTRKITKWIGKFYNWKEKNPSKDPGEFPVLRLGNLDAKRDWGHAVDYVKAMWLMLQQEKPDDYMIATNKCHSVRDFLNEAFNTIGIQDWEPYVVIDSEFFRPAEVESLCGDFSKAEKILKWHPETPFNVLVKEMVMHDISTQTKTV